MKIEIHTDGTKWVACSKEYPLLEESYDGARGYHPDAKVTYTSSDGSDDHYECPHCKKGWWVEYDG